MQNLPSANPRPSPNGLGVLVVDDEPAVCRLLDTALRLYGVRVAGGGAEAVEIYRRHRGDIGVVLMDVQMPRVDGPRTLDALRAVDPGVRVVLMTGNAGGYTADELARRGASRVIPKPFASLASLAAVLIGVAGSGT